MSTANAGNVATLNTGLPGVRWIQKAIRDQLNVDVEISSQEVLRGKIRWQDPECLCLIDNEGKEWIVWRQALVYIRAQGQGDILS